MPADLARAARAALADLLHDIDAKAANADAAVRRAAQNPQPLDLK
jgi:hypothetical protein